MNLSDDERRTVEALPNQQRELFYHKLRAVEAVIDRQRGSMAGEVSRQAAALGVSPSTINRWMAQVKQHGATGLIDNRSHR